MRFWAAIVGCASLALASFAQPVLGASSSADSAAGRAGLLTLQDFPSGWAPTPRSKSSSSAVVKKLVSTIPACKVFIPLLGNSKSGRRSESRSSFTDGTVTVDNSVTVYPDVQHASVPLTAVRTSTFSDCLEPLFRDGIRAELAKTGKASLVKNLAVAAQAANPGVTVGDDQAAFAATVTLSAQGIPASFYFEDIVVRAGRALDSFSYSSDNGPIGTIPPTPIEASVARLQTALGLPTPGPVPLSRAS
jgi:hypothetical protein